MVSRTIPSRLVPSSALKLIESIGNKLPHPFYIFWILAGFVLCISELLSLMRAEVIHPTSGDVIQVKSLISREGIQWVLTSALSNFINFKPLSLVLAMNLGIGLAKGVGLIETAICVTLSRVSGNLLTPMVFVIGIVGSLASDAAIIIIPPLAAMMFQAAGRHPVAGMVAGFAATSSGFTANFFITGTDALLSGISTEAIQSMRPGMEVTPVSNWYFMSLSVLFLAGVGVLISERFVEPGLGSYKGSYVAAFTPPTRQEKNGLLAAFVAGLLFLLVLCFLILPEGALLRDSQTGSIVPSPFLKGIVPLIILFCVLVSVVYGVVAGTIAGSRDIPDKMTESMQEMAGFLVIAFAMSQFIAYFNWTNLSVWLAVTGGEWLSSVDLSGTLFLMGFLALTAFLNLFIVSGSAQWALMAPVFLPMTMVLGYHPAFIQLCFRIADSSTNTISPLNVYLPMVLIFLKRYQKTAGLGSLISYMFPYAVGFLLAWVLLLLAWLWLGWDVGVGGPIYLSGS